MTTVTARIDEETHRLLEQLAESTQRSRSWLIADALKRYIGEEAWQIAAIEEGIREADAGNFASPEEVKGALSRWGIDDGQN